MTKTLNAALLAAALGAASGIAAPGAFAQDTAPAEKPITIKLGAFLPSSGYLKNATSNSWFSAGAEYAFVPHTVGGTSTALIPLGYVDYAVSNRHGVNADYVGVGPGVRYNLTPAGSSSLTPYVGAGIGAYFLHASSFGGSSNRTNFGYRLNAGVEFQRTYLFEVSYTDPESLDGVRFNGFKIQVGARF